MVPGIQLRPSVEWDAEPMKKDLCHWGVEETTPEKLVPAGGSLLVTGRQATESQRAAVPVQLHLCHLPLST